MIVESKLPVLGLVITQKNEVAKLSHNIEYHRYMGVSRFYIFDDDSTDASMQSIRKNTQSVQRYYGTDFSIAPKEMMEVKQKALDGNWMGRQLLNTYKALQLAKKDGVDWLIFIDADELVFLGSEEENSFISFFAKVNRNVDVVFFEEVYEAVPQNINTDNIFKKANLFKTTAYDKHAEKTMLNPMSGKTFSLCGFFGPSSGKQAARVSANLIPNSSHGFKRRNGENPKTLTNGQIMHYHLCDFEDFLKRSSIKHPSHYIYGLKVPYYPKIFWRELGNLGLSKSELQAYYKKYIAFSKKEIKYRKKQLKEGEPFIVEFNKIIRVWEKIDKRLVENIESILVEKHKVAFIVLSKNACTSMKAHIAKVLGFSKTVIYPKDAHAPFIYPYPLTNDKELFSTYRAYTRFCIVRNPWARLVSCYKNKIQAIELNNYDFEDGVYKEFTKYSSDFRAGMSFADFVDIVCTLPDSNSDRHFRSQLYDIISPKGELRANYIAKLENLPLYLEEINQLTGLSFDDFPTVNTSNKKSIYTDYYTPKTIEKVRKRFAGDIEVFNYEFGGKNKFSSGKISNCREAKILESHFVSEILKEKTRLVTQTPSYKSKSLLPLQKVNKENILKRNIFTVQKSIFCFLPGSGNSFIKASLISYIETRRKFVHRDNIRLIDAFSVLNLEDYFKFTIVRNPWDRLASLYKEIIHSDEFQTYFFKMEEKTHLSEYSKVFRKDMTFEEFIDTICSIPESEANNYFCSQSYQLTTADGKLLPNYIGYYEHLEKVASVFYDHTQISLHKIPLEKGKVKDTSYTELYSEELQEKVRRKFAADIEIFGYEFGVPLKHVRVDYVSDEFAFKFYNSKFFADILKEKNLELEKLSILGKKTLNMLEEDLCKTKKNRLKKSNSLINEHFFYFRSLLSQEEFKLLRLASKIGEDMFMQKVDDIQNSLSWRITAPLRRFVSFFVKNINRDK